MNPIELLRLIRGHARDGGRVAVTIRRQRDWERRGVGVATSAVIRLDRNSVLKMGVGTTVGPYAILDLLSDPLATDPRPSRILIGRNVAVKEFSNIRAGGGEVSIGDGCLIAQYVSIIGSNHSTGPGSFIREQSWDSGKLGVSIGEDVWVGAHAVVLTGARTGPGAVVGAGAVVTSDVPDGAIVAGVPAQFIGHRGKTAHGFERRHS